MSGRKIIKPDLELINYLNENGGGDPKKCYQCATCTSVCRLSTEEYGFPRRQVLLAQWGLKEQLMKDPSPWLCFYCGDCSKRCPRKSNPGETMMNLRRYLTSLYDWTGLSRLMYRSVFWEMGVLLVVAAAIVLMFTLPRSFGFGLLAQSGSAPLSTVMLDKFAPAGIVDIGDRIMAVALALLLLSNAARMLYGLTSGENIPFSFYISQLPYFVIQGITQKQWGRCGSSDSTTNWLRHLFLVTGYVIMFTLVVVFLPSFQVNGIGLHWTSYLGYYATLVLLSSTVWILVDRIKKRTEMHAFSHFSDWMFPVLLFLSALSGILLHIFRISNMPLTTYYTYMIHLVIVVPMLVVEVPFGKWSHLLYRPLALYVAAVRNKAKEFQVERQIAGSAKTAASA